MLAQVAHQRPSQPAPPQLHHRRSVTVLAERSPPRMREAHHDPPTASRLPILLTRLSVHRTNIPGWLLSARGDNRAAAVVKPSCSSEIGAISTPTST
jgi:hypothetical protein